MIVTVAEFNLTIVVGEIFANFLKFGEIHHRSLNRRNLTGRDSAFDYGRIVSGIDLYFLMENISAVMTV